MLLLPFSGETIGFRRVARALLTPLLRFSNRGTETRNPSPDPINGILEDSGKRAWLYEM